MPRQFFFPTDVNKFEVQEGNNTRKVIEFLFSANDLGDTVHDSRDRWENGSRINRNWGGWGQHGQDRWMQQIWFLNKGAIYWNVAGASWTGSNASDVSWDYTAGVFGGSDAGAGHDLHTSVESQGGQTDTPFYLGFGLNDAQFVTAPFTWGTSDGYGGSGSEGPYPGDPTEQYQWYPGNYRYVTEWVNDNYDDTHAHHYWYCMLIANTSDANNDTLQPIQLKDASGARYSIPSYDPEVSQDNAIANSNPTNCLDLIDGSTDPMTDVNPRFDTKYDGVGQGKHNGVVYFQMPEWEGGMWASQLFAGDDVSSLSKDASGDWRSFTMSFNHSSVRCLIHEAFTSYGPPAGRAARHEAQSAVGRARVPDNLSIHWGQGNYLAKRGRWYFNINDGDPNTTGETENRLNPEFEKYGWYIIHHSSGANDSGTLRWQSGTWNDDGPPATRATWDTSEQYGAEGHGTSGQNPHSFAIGHHSKNFAASNSTDDEFTFELALHYGTPYLKYSMTGLPTGLEFDPENRVIHGVLPTASGNANTTVTYTATDFYNQSNSITFTLTAVGYSDANHVDAAAAAAAAEEQATLDAAEAAAAAAAALAAAQADQYASEQAAAEAMVILGSGIRRTRDLSTDLVRPDKYLDADLLTSDDPKGIPVAVTPDTEQGELLDYMW